MDLSYTQNLEDYHLSLAFAGQVTGRYIDVGAGHPVADNVSCWFYQRGWRGIVVEPQPELAALYARLRPRDTVVQALVGRTNGERDFFLVERLHGFSTTIERHAQNAQALGVGYRSLRLPVVTLASLCEAQGVGEIDFLKIDVEGAEPDVLAGGDFKRFRPKVIVAEAVAPGSGGAGLAGLGAAIVVARLPLRAVRHSQSLLRCRGASRHHGPPAARARRLARGASYV